MDTSQMVTDDELDEKTWRQLRQCTRVALYYLRGQAKDEYLPAKRILAELERVLSPDWDGT